MKNINPSTQDVPDNLHNVYEHIARHAERGATVCIISDFHDAHEHHKAALLYLADHFETIAIRIIDPAEETLQKAGRLRMTSPTSGRIAVIDTDDATIRQRYNELMARHSAELKEIFTTAGIQYLAVYNNKDAFRQLDLLS